MVEMQIILSIVALLAIILAMIFLIGLRRWRIGGEPNYPALFILGILWLPIGVLADNLVFLILGLAFIIFGLSNKDRWGGESQRTSSRKVKWNLGLGRNTPRIFSLKSKLIELWDVVSGLIAELFLIAGAIIIGGKLLSLNISFWWGIVLILIALCIKHFLSSYSVWK